MATSKVDVQVTASGAEQAADQLTKLGNAGAEATARIHKGGREASSGLLALEEASHLAHARVAEMAHAAGPLGDILIKLGPAGLAAAAGIGAIGALAHEALAAAEALELRMLKVQAALSATGYASGQTAEEIEQLSIAMSTTTRAGMADVQQAATQLLAFRSVSGEVFGQTLKLAQDLSAAGFGGLAENAVKLGRALDEPVQGLTTLRGVGIVFSEQLKEQVKDLEDHGHHLEAQQIIIAELTRRVGGVGAAERDTLTGAWHAFTQELELGAERLGKSSGLLDVMQAAVEGLTSAVHAYNQVPDLDTRIAALNDRADRAEFDGDHRWAELLRDQAVALREQAKAQHELEQAEKARAVAGQQAAAEERRQADFKAKIDAAEVDALKILRDLRDEMREEENKAADQLEKEQAARDKVIEGLVVQADSAVRLFAALREGEDSYQRTLRDLEVEKNLRQLGADATAEQTQRVIELTVAAFDAKAAIDDFNDAQKKAEEQAKKVAAEAQKEADALVRATEKANKEILKQAQEMSAQVVDAFINILEGSKNPLDGLAAYVKKTFEQIAAAAIITPIVQPIILSAVSAAVGGLGGGIGGGPGLTGGGALGTASSLAGLGSNAGLFAGLGSTVAGGINSFGAGIGLTASPAPMLYGAPTGLLGGTASLTSVLGAAGLGAIGGGLLAGLLGENKTGGSIGGGIGATIGMLTPLGPVGALIGGALGSIVGGLFGSNPSDRLEGATLDLITGARSLYDLGPKKQNPEAERAVGSFLDAVASVRDMLQQTTGGRVGTRNVALEVGLRTGTNVYLDGAKTQVQSVEEAFRLVLKGMVDSIEGLTPDVQAAIQQLDPNGDLQKFGDDLEFIVGFKDTVAAMIEGALSIRDSVKALASEEIKTATAQIRDFKDTAARLGLDTDAATEATRRYVERLVGLGAPAGPASQLDRQLQILEGTFEALAPLLAEVNLGVDAMTLKQQALARVLADVNAGDQARLDDVSGRRYLNDLRAATTTVTADRADRLRLPGGNTTIVDAIFAGSVKNIIDQAVRAAGAIDQAGDALSLIKATFADVPEIVSVADAAIANLADTFGLAGDAANRAADATERVHDLLRRTAETQSEAIDTQARASRSLLEAMAQAERHLNATLLRLDLDPSLSLLTPQALFDATQARFDDTSRRSLLGDQDAFAEIGDLGVGLVELARQMFGSTDKTVAIQTQVKMAVAAARDVAGRHKDIASQQLDVLEAQLVELRRIASGQAPDGTPVAPGPAATALDFAALTQQYRDYGAPPPGSVSFGVFENSLLDLVSRTSDADLIRKNISEQSGRLSDPLFGGSAQRILDAFTGRAQAIGIPGYAAGGLHPGGLYLAGERGIEIGATGPARFYSHRETRDLLAGAAIDAGELTLAAKATTFETAHMREELIGMRRELKRVAALLQDVIDKRPIGIAARAA